jgi:hypothetical protein
MVIGTLGFLGCIESPVEPRNAISEQEILADPILSMASDILFTDPSDVVARDVIEIMKSSETARPRQGEIK